eukprot:5628095-Prymnesium_polylepis.1
MALLGEQTVCDRSWAALCLIADLAASDLAPFALGRAAHLHRGAPSANDTAQADCALGWLSPGLAIRGASCCQVKPALRWDGAKSIRRPSVGHARACGAPCCAGHT